MAGMKFCGSTSRLLLLSVPAFIMLSAGAVVTEKSRNCYWCGPLAEQVHKSQRAPSCLATSNHVTACDPDLPYCAVVATSPPYIESRLCVKLYQDECYPLYCNSTKSWKMTCPCRGDLCNGPNSEREDEAFAILAKLVAKTRNTRIKKRTQLSAAKFFIGGAEKTVIVTNISAVDNNDLDNTDSNTSDQVTQIMLGDEPRSMLEEMKSEPSTADTSASGEIEEEEIKTTAKVKQENLNESIATTTLEVKETTKDIEIKKTETVNVVTTTPGIEDNSEGTQKIDIENIVKPSEVLPAAEALQQNTTPKSVSEKTTQATLSYETTYQTTDSELETTTEKHAKKNGQGKIIYNVYILLTNICISAYL